MYQLTIESRGQYRNKKRNIVFRYAVKGKADAMQAYEDAQGQYYTVDDKTGEVMYFTPRFAGRTATLCVTDEGRVYVDMSELEQQASLVAQLGGNLGQAMADEIAKRFGGKTSMSTPTVKPEGESDEKTEEPEKAEPKPSASARRVRR